MPDFQGCYTWLDDFASPSRSGSDLFSPPSSLLCSSIVSRDSLDIRTELLLAILMAVLNLADCSPPATSPQEETLESSPLLFFLALTARYTATASNAMPNTPPATAPATAPLLKLLPVPLAVSDFVEGGERTGWLDACDWRLTDDIGVLEVSNSGVVVPVPSVLVDENGSGYALWLDLVESSSSYTKVTFFPPHETCLDE